MSQLAFLEPSSPVPAGATGSWFTDLGWFLETERELLRDRLIPRPFDLDPSAHPEAPVSRYIRDRGGVIYTREDDGLSRNWAERVGFFNPEYDADTLDRWCGQVNDHEIGGRMHGRVALLPAWPDRAWWQDHIEPGRRRGSIDVRFIRGRLHFGWVGNPKGVGGDGAMFPSAVVIWRGAA